MNLVKILSHDEDVEYLEEKKNDKKNLSCDKVPVEAHALTIKEDCIDSLLEICTEVRP
jgi:hypothetical protein